ncbi:unnamed protein product [Penicillium camemberti]|uniref:Str. FM013 n=1 Tax=Penicillium camemberti (strain FM 013) TaxID=1429867 RepID=A0A0G4NTU6_PENC3|nr:unnamed protein product [Penicillium camemberti]
MPKIRLLPSGLKSTTVPTTPQDHIIRWRIRYTEFAEVLIHSILQ